MNWDAGVSEFERALRWYPAAIKELESSTEKKSGLVDLDTELWTKTGAAAQKRSPPHVELPEYRRLVQWKLKRGKWRPRLQRFADELAPALIKDGSSKALRALAEGKPRDALKILVELPGCGPATASAVLAACDENVPFMGDELLIAVFDGKRDYTLAAYMKLLEQVKRKADELGKGWNARKIEHAVFAAAIAKLVGKEDELMSDEAGVKESEGKDIEEEKEPVKEKGAKRIAKKRANRAAEGESVRKSARLARKT